MMVKIIVQLESDQSKSLRNKSFHKKYKEYKLLFRRITDSYILDINHIAA